MQRRFADDNPKNTRTRKKRAQRDNTLTNFGLDKKARGLKTATTRKVQINRPELPENKLTARKNLVLKERKKARTPGSTR